jgi:hypothetical protein
MGRMLEALSRPDARKERSPEPIIPIAGKIAEPEPAPAAETEPAAVEEQVPFIEVGGPRSLIDASADVLAAGPPTASPSEPRPQVMHTDPEDGAAPRIEGTVAIWCSWTLRKGIKRDQ